MVKNEDIIKPFIFLDIFDYPPTGMEVWRFLGVKAELSDIVISNRSVSGGEKSIKTDYNSLTHNPVAENKIDARRIETDSSPHFVPLRMTNKNGFYSLNSSSDSTEKRQTFFQLSEKKFKIAKQAAKILRFVPGIKMAAVCNNFYYHPESDIDFFIIVEKNRMWLTRALSGVALHLFRLRRHGKKIADRICLSFYITEDNLDLEEITLKSNNQVSDHGIEIDSSQFRITGISQNDKSRGSWNNKNGEDPNSEIDDPYFCYWLAFLQPIYDAGGVYEKFWQANSWIKNIFPNIFPTKTNETKIIKDNFFSVFCKKINYFWFSGVIGNFLERIARKIQLGKMLLRHKTHPVSEYRATPLVRGDLQASCSKGVVISDNILKFHDNDKREYFKDQLKIKSEELKINV